MRSLSLLALAVSVSVPLFAQEQITLHLMSASTLIQQGHFTDAIDSLTPLAKNGSLAPRERGRAQMLLGLANRNLWHIAAAENLYGQALDTLGREGKETADYANALDCMGILQLTKGDWKAAAQTLNQAAAIDRKLGAHAALAEVDLHLSTLALRRKKLKDAEKYLEAAGAEIPMSVPHGKQLTAVLDGLRAWLASLQGHYADAAASYAAALEDSKTAYGEEHPATAWVYLLAGRSASDAGSAEAGLGQMRTGLQILRDTLGTESAEYATGELAYSAVLEKNGKQAEAGALHADAVRVLATNGPSCANCTVSVWSLRNR